MFLIPSCHSHNSSRAQSADTLIILHQPLLECKVEISTKPNQNQIKTNFKNKQIKS